MYILPSAKKRVYFCNSIAIEMGSVPILLKSIKVGGRFDTPNQWLFVFAGPNLAVVILDVEFHIFCTSVPSHIEKRSSYLAHDKRYGTCRILGDLSVTSGI